MKLVQMPNGDWVRAATVQSIFVDVDVDGPTLKVIHSEGETLSYAVHKWTEDMACKARDDFAAAVNASLPVT